VTPSAQGLQKDFGERFQLMLLGEEGNHEEYGSGAYINTVSCIFSSTRLRPPRISPTYIFIQNPFFSPALWYQKLLSISAVTRAVLGKILFP